MTVKQNGKEVAILVAESGYEILEKMEISLNEMKQNYPNSTGAILQIPSHLLWSRSNNIYKFVSGFYLVLEGKNQMAFILQFHSNI